MATEADSFRNLLKCIRNVQICWAGAKRKLNKPRSLDDHTYIVRRALTEVSDGRLNHLRDVGLNAVQTDPTG